MSGNQPEQSSSDQNTYRTADEIIRSILDDHASSSTDISPSGELYRAIERFHANAHRRPALVSSARRHLTRWASASRNSMSSEPNFGSETHRRFSREPQASNDPVLGAHSLPSLRSLNIVRRTSAMSNSGPSNISGRNSRPRAAERYAERNRAAASSQTDLSQQSGDLMQRILLERQERQQARRMRMGRDSIRAQQQMEDANAQHQLDDATDQLRALLEFTHTPSHPYSELSFPSPPLQTHGPAEESRRVKRRKLDSDRTPEIFRGFRYGRYGQIEPGPLTMEMVSCDGGNYSEDGISYTAENILKNDSTVYCTKGPRCNIVLRHQGATVFTLKELVIKAPQSDYTAPVQEGMVFLSMDDDEGLTRTAKYQIQYLSLSRRSERESQPLAPILSVRNHDDGTTMTRAQVRARRLYNIGMEAEDNDHRVAQIPLEFTATPPPFWVTTECSDEENGDVTSRADWRAPNRIGSLPFESDSSDEGGNLDDLGLSGAGNQLRRRHNRSNIALAETAESTQDASHEAMRARGGEMLAPYARFFIERDKSKCTIKFNPPVSGRFILLKMWSPNRGDPMANIDIQAVVAKGFAGPRYFPSVELR